jgi:hypothetical protein
MRGLLVWLSCQLAAVLAVNPGLNQGTGSNYGETCTDKKEKKIFPIY